MVTDFLKQHFLVRTIAQEQLWDGYQITITTDVPCHLWMRWSIQKPWIHSVPSIRRGLAKHDDVYFCFTVYHDNEQEEAGDTLEHTFVKHDWPHCETRYFYFTGKIEGDEVASTTAIFKKHFDEGTAPPGPITMEIPAERSNRTLYSSHGTWATAWGGFGVKVAATHQLPTANIFVDTHLTVSYFIHRGYLSFYLPQLPAGNVLTQAKLKLHATSHAANPYAICITQGVQGEPVIVDDWETQNPIDTILGSKNAEDFVDDQYNDVDFNADGLTYLTERMTRSHQYESFDSNSNVYLPIRPPYCPAQTFTPQQTHTLTAVRLSVAKYTGSPGDIIVTIRNTDGSGAPTGPALATGTILAANLELPGFYPWYPVILDTALTVNQGTLYAICCCSPTSNATNYAFWWGSTVGTYAGGSHWYSTDGGSTWTDNYPGYDCYFVEYNYLHVGARRLCIRTIWDVHNVAPTSGQTTQLLFKAAQEGAPYHPILELTYQPV